MRPNGSISVDRSCVLAWSAAVTLAIACWAESGSQVHLIPDGFIGPVVVVFGVPEGDSAVTNGEGAAVYAFGTDGLLLLRDPAPPAGYYDIRYFYVGPDGKRSEIPYKAERDRLQVFGDVDGVTGTGPGEIRWVSYIVGVPSERHDWFEVRDSAVDRAVASVRAKAK